MGKGLVHGGDEGIRRKGLFYVIIGPEFDGFNRGLYRLISCNHYDLDIGPFFLDLPQDLDTVHLGHLQVGKDKVCLLLPQHPEPVKTVSGEPYLIPLGNEGAAAAHPDDILIVDHKNFAFAHAASLPDGSLTKKLVPSPGLVFTIIFPPWSSMMPWLTARPSPVPLPTGFVVKKGSKSFSRFSSLIPGPVSLNSTSTKFASASFIFLVVMVRVPLPSSASAAFMIMFRKTCWSCEGSALTIDRDSSKSVMSLILKKSALFRTMLSDRFRTSLMLVGAF